MNWFTYGRLSTWINEWKIDWDSEWIMNIVTNKWINEWTGLKISKISKNFEKKRNGNKIFLYELFLWAQKI